MSDRRSTQQSLESAVGAQAKRKLAAKNEASKGLWFGLGMMGLIGWSVVGPTVIGTAVGLWLDRHHPGRIGWTLALLVAGLTLGCLNAWHWVANEQKAMHENQEHDDE